MILDPSLWGSYAGTFADWEGEDVTEPYYKTPDGKVTLLHGHVLDVLREMPAESVNCVVTSPPYWSLRKYDCEPVVWGGDPNCPHTLEAQPVGGESYEGKARWQHDGVSRQETPEAWVRAPSNDDHAGNIGPRNEQGDAFRNSARYVDQPAFRPAQDATCSLCGAWRGQYGLEPTPELYVEHTLMWLREVKRVLRKDGTLWLNIGDSMAGGNSRYGTEETASEKQRSNSGTMTFMGQRPSAIAPGLKAKDCVLMPFRVALAAQADGWWVRSVIIWAKPNPMPESVRDRPTDAHEYIFLLTRSKNYWYDADAVREGLAESTLADSRNNTGRHTQDSDKYQHDVAGAPDEPSWYRGKTFVNPVNGRNCRSVWTFPTQGFPDAHFAVFPRELPERCIKAGCPEWVCPKCGKARVRVTEILSRKEHPAREHRNVRNKADFDGADYARRESTLGLVPDKTVESWSDCGCGAGFVGGVVLDPFAGSGTTCEVAYHLGRTAIGIDASAKYLDMAIERVKQGALL